MPGFLGVTGTSSVPVEDEGIRAGGREGMLEVTGRPAFDNRVPLASGLFAVPQSINGSGQRPML